MNFHQSERCSMGKAIFFLPSPERTGQITDKNHVDLSEKQRGEDAKGGKTKHNCF